MATKFLSQSISCVGTQPASSPQAERRNKKSLRKKAIASDVVILSSGAQHLDADRGSGASAVLIDHGELMWAGARIPSDNA